MLMALLLFPFCVGHYGAYEVMNDKNDDIFEFDPTSFCQELPQYERVDYVTLTNRYKGEVVHFPSKIFKFNSK